MSATLPHTASDLCELMERLARTGDYSYGFSTGWALFEAARDGGLVDDDAIGTVARWTGELVDEGLVTYQSRPASMAAVPRGVIWGDTEFQSHYGYRLTAEGRAEADRARRRLREIHADLVLAGQLRLPDEDRLDEGGRRGVLAHVGALRGALTDERWADAIGAAKDAVESAAKAVLTARGETPPTNAKLAALYRAALASADAAVDDDAAAGWNLARGLVGVVQELATLRNAAGSGHGHAEVPSAAQPEAELAAGAAVVLVRHVIRA